MDVVASEAPVTTSSRGTRLLGLLALMGVLTLLLFAFVLTNPDVRTHPTSGEEFGQFDAVRLLYLHVPMAILTYAAFALCAATSAGYLLRRTPWWDVTAHAAAEVGTLVCALVLVTGSIWGRPVWNTWWEWGDVRLMTTLVLFLLFLGYLALRRATVDPGSAARPAAIVALVAVLDIPLINRSVEWWENRTLHQKSTLAELKIEDLTLFTLVLGIIVFGLVVAWLLVHRFRVGWLERAEVTHGVDQAITERRGVVSVADLDSTAGRMEGES